MYSHIFALHRLHPFVVVSMRICTDTQTHTRAVDVQEKQCVNAVVGFYEIHIEQQTNTNASCVDRDTHRKTMERIARAIVKINLHTIPSSSSSSFGDVNTAAAHNDCRMYTTRLHRMCVCVRVSLIKLEPVL